jgi:hypothetical protein
VRDPNNPVMLSPNDPSPKAPKAAIGPLEINDTADFAALTAVVAEFIAPLILVGNIL